MLQFENRGTVVEELQNNRKISDLLKEEKTSIYTNRSNQSNNLDLKNN